jgi:hypothetical protein
MRCCNKETVVKRIDINELSDESYKCVLDALTDHLLECIQDIDEPSIHKMSPDKVLKYIKAIENIKNETKG